MSAANLLQPILDGVQRNNFFNGRLLSAEDLRAEQDASREATGNLARAIGDGVAWGFDVAVSSAADLVVTVRKGLALNRHLDALSLTDDTDLTLVPATSVAATGDDDAFKTCNPPRDSIAYTGAGAYLLVVAPASGYSGTATVSDPNTTAAGRGACGARFSVEGVRFRLVPIALNRLRMDSTLLADITVLLPPSSSAARERLRNRLAHLCFGTRALGAYFDDPLAPNGNETSWIGWGAVDAMRDIGDISDCDVPLAIVVLTDAGISFVDTWSVRRKIVGGGAVGTWRGAAGPRRTNEAEAAFLQLQSQLQVIKTLATPSQIAAATYLDALPAAGWLPTGSAGFDWKTFLGTHAPDAVSPIDAALVRGVIEESWFDEPFYLSTTPPVPLRVYQVPNAPYVVFARSRLGSIRVVLSPAPTTGQEVGVQVDAATGGSLKGSTLAGNRITVTDVAPGAQTVTITAPDYVAIAPIAATAIGGRTVDVGVTLTPLPNGSILVHAVDAETDDALATSRVLSVVATNGSSFNAVARGGSWVFDSLPDGQYSVSGTARGYLSVSLSDVAVTKGSVTEITLRFTPAPHAPHPPLCVAVASIEALHLQKVRLCMVLKATEFEQKYFYGKEGLSELASIANDNFRIASRKDAVAERGKRLVASSGELLYGSRPPWFNMILLKDLPTGVREWLGQWRDWLADDLGLDDIKKVAPSIAVDRAYRYPKSATDIPELPSAYAVFNHFGIPLSIRPESGLTRLPVEIDHAVMPWVMAETFEALAAADIAHLNDLAWAWSELVVDATGDPPDTAPYLIFDAVSSADAVNKARSYYPGVTAVLNKALSEAGFATDLAIANATANTLMKVVKSRGFAVRLIYEARQIVPESSWSIQALGFSTQQSKALRAMEIDSMGALLEASGKTTGKDLIARALDATQLTGAEKELLILPFVNDATIQLTSNAIALAPQVTLSLWAGTDTVTAQKLDAQGISSVDTLAHANADDVASAVGISSDDAKTLIAKAQTESIAQADVASVLSISSRENTHLATTFGTEKPTVGGLLTKSPADLSATFGDAARATAVLAGIKQGLRTRGIG